MKTLLAALLLLLTAHSAHADGVGKLLGISRPSAGCSQATTFLARTSGLNATHTNAYTTLICGMVTDGTWCGSLFDAFYIFATQDSTTALLNLCSASFNLTANGSPTFTADAGFTGVDASSTVYLDTASNFSAYPNYTLNAAHISAWSFTNAASSAGGGNMMGGIANAIGTSSFDAKYSDGNAYCAINDNNGDPGSANANATGWYVCDRSDSTHSTLYRNATSFSTPNQTSSAVPTVHSTILAVFYDSAGTPISGTGLQVPMASIGGHLTAANVTSVYSRLCTFLTTVHGSC
jgi:hypothetical protein